MTPLSVTRFLSRRRFLSLMAAAVGGTVLASCAPKPTPTEAPKTEPTQAQPTAVPATKAPEVQKVTLSMWTHDKLSVDFYNQQVELWKKDYPQYEFTFDFQTIPYGEVFTKVLTALAAGSGAPDTVGIEISAFGRFMKGTIAEKGLVDLTDWIGAERKKFVEGRWTPYMVRGKIYGVECALCPVGYWYQPAILEAAGIQVPIKTWEDFAIEGRKLAANKKYIALVDDTGWAAYMMLLWQRGGGVFAEDGSVTISKPEAIEVLQYLVDGANKDKFLYKSGADGYFGAPTMGAFKDGTIAGAWGADWYLGGVLKPQLADMSGKWRLAPLPLWSKGGHKSSTWGGTAWSVTKQSPHADLAWSLIHFAQMTVEGQVARFKVEDFFPTMYDAMKDPRIADLPNEYCGGQKTGSVFATVADDMPIEWQSAFLEPAFNELTNQLTKAYAGDLTPEQAIQAADTNIKAIIAKGE